MRRVIVGIEDLPHNEAALDWAARQAEHRGAPLVLVHSHGFPMAAIDLLEDLPDMWSEVLLEKAAARVHELHPAVEVETVLDRRPPAAALVEIARDDDHVVVGTHRLGTMERMFSGSLAYQVVAHAPCPVAVVPGPPKEGAAGVVVGVDGSSHSVDALDVAAGVCEWTGQELTVVHALPAPSLYVSNEHVPPDVFTAYYQSERLLIGEVMAGLAQRHPDVRGHVSMVHEQPATALLAAAEDAWLLVVGSRGRYGLPRLLLGSTSHTVVLHAPCPVLVVRAGQAGI